MEPMGVISVSACHMPIHGHAPFYAHNMELRVNQSQICLHLMPIEVKHINIWAYSCIGNSNSYIAESVVLTCPNINTIYVGTAGKRDGTSQGVLSNKEILREGLILIIYNSSAHYFSGRQEQKSHPDGSSGEQVGFIHSELLTATAESQTSTFKLPIATLIRVRPDQG